MIKNKCLFVHIPKNAGSSVLKFFDDKGYRWHAKWFDFFESNPVFFESFHKFAIVREPLQRVFSAYNYIINGGNHSPSDLELKAYIENGSENFEQFVENVLDHDFLLFQTLFQPQVFYIYDRHYKCRVDTILHYENLDSEWLAFSKSQNWHAQLPWENKGHITKVADISASAQAKIKALYQKDYELLGYQ
ncbi:sulfotransferase family 2 domain-containing protein [Pseudoalteromonas sp. MMG005]|uniref:sulfotransferase family 2 domain-containing protein n=1 Tax=Pseudoalteromonas sp. MMG005 TaxID=2822682 RepID=UPI001B39D8F7|nr:sulfotransferase family 2 domain-containing protein [Pseudoalteromonas sp. MMG005]MBQ4844356.1 sulfotransferase family 2 domain-containing protein [Pseudoalteromonas sp. MMG005]